MPRNPTLLIDDVRGALARAYLGASDHVVVGLSGGIDSLTLTHLLATLRDTGEGPAPYAVHIDHGLRPSSATDAATVERLAGSLGVPIEVVRVDVGAWESGRGVEAAARDARYAALAGAAGRHDARWVVLGHTLDDQAETVVLRLSRGTSLDGLTGMQEISTRAIRLEPSEDHGVAVQFLRPLIRTRRSEIEAYAVSFGLRPVEDESNADPRFRRNAVRHQVLPLLEQIIPGAVESIARTAGLLQADAGFISSHGEHASQDLVQSLGPCLALDRGGFAGLPLALQRRVVANVVHRLPVDLDLTSERIEALRQAATDGEVASVIQFGRSTAAYIDYDWIVFGDEDEIIPALRRDAGRPILDSESVVELTGDGTVMLGDDWVLEFTNRSGAAWALRTRRPGDRVRLASGQPQRLQDWFVNHKVPGYLRDQIPLLARDGTIRWVIGFSSCDFEDVDSGITARFRERSVEDQRHVQ